MVCELCDYNQATVVHHRDRNRLNNSPKNLQVLCWNCHYLQHHPEGCDGHKTKERLIVTFRNKLHKKDIENMAITIAKKEDIVYASKLVEYTGISRSLASKVLKKMEISGILSRRNYSPLLNMYYYKGG